MKTTCINESCSWPLGRPDKAQFIFLFTGGQPLTFIERGQNHGGDCGDEECSLSLLTILDVAERASRLSLAPQFRLLRWPGGLRLFIDPLAASTAPILSPMEKILATLAGCIAGFILGIGLAAATGLYEHVYVYTFAIVGGLALGAASIVAAGWIARRLTSQQNVVWGLFTATLAAASCVLFGRMMGLIY